MGRSASIHGLDLAAHARGGAVHAADRRAVRPARLHPPQCLSGRCGGRRGSMRTWSITSGPRSRPSRARCGRCSAPITRSAAPGAPRSDDPALLAGGALARGSRARAGGSICSPRASWTRISSRSICAPQNQLAADAGRGADGGAPGGAARERGGALRASCAAEAADAAAPDARTSTSSTCRRWRGSSTATFKTDKHPHTNMAKAALNMMTRDRRRPTTCSDGIHMNSVDTGWVTDEDPAELAARKTRGARLPPAAGHRGWGGADRRSHLLGSHHREARLGTVPEGLPAHGLVRAIRN